MQKKHLGGSFAPPLTDSLLSTYSSLVSSLPVSPLKDGLTVLLNCSQKWWEQPESKGEGRPHPVGVGLIIDLDEPIKQALDPHIPWDEELAMIQGLCDAIPGDQKPLRDCAFHLLWHARELALDREPMTNDKL